MPYSDPQKQKKAQRESYLRNKETTDARSKQTREKRYQRVRDLKSDPCVDCKNSFHYSVMDFDHVRGDKIGDVSRLIRVASWQTVEDEIKKCDLVCANCHRFRTWQRRGQHSVYYTGL